MGSRLTRGLGDYQIANYSVWLPSEIRDELARFGRAVTATNNDVSSHRNALIAAGAEGTRFWNDWQVFQRDYAAFAARTATSTMGAITDERGLVDRYNPLDARFRALTGVSSTAVSADSRAPWFTLPGSSVLGTGGSLGLIAAAGLGVVGLVALAVLATQARAIMMRNPRPRRRRKRNR